MKTIRFIKKKEGIAVGDVRRVAAVTARNNIASGYAVEVVEDNATTETPVKPLSKMTVAELLAYAQENSIDLGAAKTKAEIVAVIETPKAPVAPKAFSEYTMEELVAYAASNNIDLGEATELEDVLEIVENMAPKP